MANKHRGEVSLQALGQTWKLRFSTNSLCELEEQAGEPLQSLAGKMDNPETARIGTLRAILWAGLLDNHEGITLRQAGDIIDDLGTADAGAKIGEAFQLAFPEADGKANPPRAKAG